MFEGIIKDEGYDLPGGEIIMSKTTSYTDSAISDLIKQFFTSYKDDSGYKYINMIDISLDSTSIILNVNDIFKSSFDKSVDLYDVLYDEPKRFLKAAARAAGEMFASSHPGTKKKIFVHIDEMMNKSQINDILGNQLIGKMVTVKGMIVSKTPKFNIPSQVTFVCPDKHLTILKQDMDQDLKIPIVCNNKSCKHRDFEQNTTHNDFEQYRIVVLKSNEDFSLSADELTILLSNNLVDIIQIGENVQITGYVKTKQFKNKRQDTTEYHNKVICSRIKKIDQIDYKITDDDVKTFESIVLDDDFYKKMVNSIAPGVFGLSDIKESVLLQLTRSPDRINGNAKVRGNLHIGVWGHAGVAKSKIGEWLDNYPNTKLVHSDGASAKGLLLGLEDNSQSGGKSLHAGAFVYCRDGIVIMDEFIRSNPDVKKELMTTLESGIASISKSGHQDQAIANASLYATGNAFEGEWDETVNLNVNLNMTSAELQRFDFHWVILDKFNQSHDAKIATTIIDGQEYVPEESPHNADFLYKYIKYVQKYTPKLVKGGEINKYLHEVYINLRSGPNAKTAGISPRHLNTIIRTTLTITRLHQREDPTIEDVDKALSLMRNMLNQQNVTVSEENTYLNRQFHRAMHILNNGPNEGYSAEDLFYRLRNDGTEEDIANTMIDLGDTSSQSANKKWRAVIEKLKKSPRIYIVSRKPLVLVFNRDLGDIGSYI